jgi:cell division protein FtsZ
MKQTVQAITDLITVRSPVDLDFSEVKALMARMKTALVGSGLASGESRAIDASQRAIASPLLGKARFRTARNIIVNITAGPDLTLYEVRTALTHVRNAAEKDASVLFGAVIDQDMKGKMRVTIVASGSVTVQPRYVQRPVDEAQRPMMTRRSDDLDVPTFLRKKAD